MTPVPHPARPSRQLDSGHCLANASQSCTLCRGLGQTETPIFAKRRICKCVHRRVFRDTLRFFKDAGEEYGAVTLDFASTIDRSGARYNRGGVTGNWGRKHREFRADFCLTAQRVLDEDHHRIFRFHCLLGADFRLCCRRLGIDRGTFFHAVYRMEEAMGAALVERELFPIGIYFGANSLEGKLPGENKSSAHGTHVAWHQG